MSPTTANFELAMLLFEDVQNAGYTVGKLKKIRSQAGIGYVQEPMSLYIDIVARCSKNKFLFEDQSVTWVLETNVRKTALETFESWMRRANGRGARERLGCKISIKLSRLNQKNIKSITHKEFGTAVSLEELKSFAANKVTKMLKSCRDRTPKIEAKEKQKQERKRNDISRSVNWHNTSSECIPKGELPWFLDRGCTTMQLKIKPGDDETIAKIIAVLSEKSADEVLSLFTLENIK